MISLSLHFRLWIAVFVLFAAENVRGDDTAKGRFNNEVLPVLMKKSQAGFAPKQPFWVKFSAIARNFKNGQQTVLQETEGESTFFDDKTANTEMKLSVNGRSYHSFALFNDRYAANLAKGNNGVFAIEGLELMKSEQGKELAYSNFAEYFGLPLIYGMSGNSGVNITEIIGNSAFEYDVSIDGPFWTLVVANKMVGDDNKQPVVTNVNVVFDSKENWRVVEIVYSYSDNSKTVNKFAYGGEYSLFADHRTGFIETIFDPNGDLRRESKLQLIESRSGDLPIAREACFLKHYGLTEPPEAKRSGRSILYLTIAAGIISIGMLVYLNRKTQRN